MSLSNKFLQIDDVFVSVMTVDVPTLEEMAEVTGQDIEQLRRDARAAAGLRREETEDSSLSASED